MGNKLLILVALLGLKTLAFADGPETALDGYCPVAYRFGKAVKGKREFASEYQGKRYLFPSAKAKNLFDANPQGFTVAYDGWSAPAIANGRMVAADPTLFELYRDRTYRFADQAAKDAFDKDRDNWIARADAHWHKLGH